MRDENKANIRVQPDAGFFSLAGWKPEYEDTPITR
jgi:hypothetical protein